MAGLAGRFFGPWGRLGQAEAPGDHALGPTDDAAKQSETGSARRIRSSGELIGLPPPLRAGAQQPESVASVSRRHGVTASRRPAFDRATLLDESDFKKAYVYTDCFLYILNSVGLAPAGLRTRLNPSQVDFNAPHPAIVESSRGDGSLVPESGKEQSIPHEAEGGECDGSRSMPSSRRRRRNVGYEMPSASAAAPRRPFMCSSTRWT